MMQYDLVKIEPLVSTTLPIPAYKVAETEINAHANNGWRVVSMVSHEHHGYLVLFEREVVPYAPAGPKITPPQPIPPKKERRPI